MSDLLKVLDYDTEPYGKWGYAVVADPQGVGFFAVWVARGEDVTLAHLDDSAGFAEWTLTEEQARSIAHDRCNTDPES